LARLRQPIGHRTLDLSKRLATSNGDETEEA
jgi:hypothetical protein